MSDNTTTPAGREGSLAAPTRHAIAWRDPDFFDEASLFKELERVYDLCHGCRRCFSLCNAFPLLFDAIDASPTRRTRQGGEEGLLGGRRSLLPVRHVLHDQVPVRAAAPLEHRLPAPDAARQGGEFPQGRDAVARQDPLVHRPRRVDRGRPGRLAGRQCRERQCDRASHARQDAGRSPGGAHTRLLQRLRAQSRCAWRHARTRGKAHARDAWPRRAVRDLLLQSQRAVHRCGPRRGIPPQRHPGHGGAAGALLRHAEARARRPRVHRGGEAGQYPGAGRARRPGPRHRRADPVVRADVQAGAAAALPRRSAGAEGQGGDVRPVRVPDAEAQGGAAAHGFRAPARQGELPRAVPPARAEPRAQDARRAQADSRHRGRGDRALLGAQRNLWSEARVSRHFHEDRSTRVRQGAGGGAGLLFERLPDGGPPDRVRHRGRQAADASADAAPHGIRTRET